MTEENLNEACGEEVDERDPRGTLLVQLYVNASPEVCDIFDCVGLNNVLRCMLAKASGNCNFGVSPVL